MGFPGGSAVKNLPASAGDSSFIPGSGRSSEEGNGNPVRYSCLGNSMDRGTWQAKFMGLQRVGHDWVTKQQRQQLFKKGPKRKGANTDTFLGNEGDLGSIPGSGRSSGEGNGNPLQYSCLGNSMDRGTFENLLDYFLQLLSAFCLLSSEWV